MSNSMTQQKQADRGGATDLNTLPLAERGLPAWLQVCVNAFARNPAQVCTNSNKLALVSTDERK